jgi:hypothetical protein
MIAHIINEIMLNSIKINTNFNWILDYNLLMTFYDNQNKKKLESKTQPVIDLKVDNQNEL